MYSNSKSYGFMSGSNASYGPSDSESGDNKDMGNRYRYTSGSQTSFGNRRNNPWSNQINHNIYWRNQYSRHSEPEHDEAFVEESGIKVFESTHGDENDDDDDDGSEEDCDDEEEENDEDPLYQLDFMDDTIVEEKEEDEDGEEEEEEEEEEEVDICKENKDNNFKDTCKVDNFCSSNGHTKDEGCENDSCCQINQNSGIKSSDTVVSNNSTDSSNQSLEVENIFSSSISQSSQMEPKPPPSSCLPQPLDKWTSRINKDSVKSTNSCSCDSVESENCFIVQPTVLPDIPSMSASSCTPVLQQSVCDLVISNVQPCIPLPITLSSIAAIPPSTQSSPLAPSVSSPTTSVLPPSKSGSGSNSRPSSRPSSRSNSPLTFGFSGNIWAGLTGSDSGSSSKITQSQPYVMSSVRGKGGRLNLSLNRIGTPRHKFTIRRVNESESQNKRNAAYMESKIQENGRQSKNMAPPIWLRRQQDSSNISTQSGKTGSEFMTSGNNSGETNGKSSNLGNSYSISQKSKALEDIESTAVQGSYRPRSGTWSMGNSRRNKLKQEKEEDVQVRQRRKSGDDILDTKEKEKKKDASPGFFDAFRPRSKSDAARGKKPNIISTVKNAMQYSLVTSGGSSRGGRRSGDATPVESQTPEEVYHTWHAGAGAKTTIGRVWEIFKHRNESSEERQRRKSGGKYEKGQLVRRHSMEPERKRNGSGHTYFRGEDPNQAAIVFRDCRGLPAAAPFLENVRRSDLEENESQILVKFFKYHTTYDLIPTSAKLVVFDTKLQVKKAFYALVYNGVRAAPLWDTERQQFVGMLTITDFIRILQSFYNCPNHKMEELEDHRLELWRKLLHDDVRELISIRPSDTLYEAIRSLIHHKIHRLPVIEPDTGNVLYIITHKRILKFLYLYINELPKPSILLKKVKDLNIGTYNNIETARSHTLIIEALNKFVERRVSALPIVDDDGKLIDIYAKFDVINLAAEGTYNNLDVTLQQANEYRNEWFEGVLKCTVEETLETIMDRIVRAEVHRLVVVDESNIVIGIISLSDILSELVLKPCQDDPDAIRSGTLAEIASSLRVEAAGRHDSASSDVKRNSSSIKTESDESIGSSAACWEGSTDGGKSETSDSRRPSTPESIESEAHQFDRCMDIPQQEILPIGS